MLCCHSYFNYKIWNNRSLGCAPSVSVHRTRSKANPAKLEFLILRELQTGNLVLQNQESWGVLRDSQPLWGAENLPPAAHCCKSWKVTVGTTRALSANTWTAPCTFDDIPNRKQSHCSHHHSPQGAGPAWRGGRRVDFPPAGHYCCRKQRWMIMSETMRSLQWALRGFSLITVYWSCCWRLQNLGTT